MKMREIAGIHAVQEALKVHGRKVSQVFLDRGFASSGELRAIEALAKKSNVRVQLCSHQQLEKFCRTHQGVAAELSESPQLDLAACSKKKHSLFMALDGIEDPHNLGAILRSAWLMGADGLFLTKSRAAPMTASAAKVACGGAEHVPVVSVSNMGSQLDALCEMGYWILGLDGAGTQKLHKMTLPEKVVWVVGGEDTGIRGATRSQLDEMVQIPQQSGPASYNASVAAAITMFETFRQWSHQGETTAE